MRQSLPGIKFIGYLPCSLLPPNILQKSLAGVPVAIYTPPTPIEHYGNAECIAEQEYDHGSYQEKTTLTFTTTDEIPRNRPLTFVATDVEGKSWLIGNREHPYPIIEVKQQKDFEKNVFEVKGTFVAQKSLVFCVF